MTHLETDDTERFGLGAKSNMECDCGVVSIDGEEIPIMHGQSMMSQHLTAREPIFINFGDVAVGKQGKRIFQIKNDSLQELEFVVEHDPASDTIYRCFEYVHNKEAVVKKSSFKCTLIYKPLFAPNVNVDNLLIYDKLGRAFPLILRGSCVGPNVQLSSNDLHFFANRKKQASQAIVEINNASSTNAYFNFDVKGNAISCFKINISSGLLKPGKHTFVTVTFAPTEYGLYSDDLYLLILGQQPKHIRLVGWYTEESVADNICFKFYKTAILHNSGYLAYLHDAASICQEPPPFSLTKTCIDFGHMEIKSDDTRTMVTSLTNHMKTNIQVVWRDDPDVVFQIVPKDVNIPPQESVLYEVTFTPKKMDSFFDSIMCGQVFWNEVKAEEDKDEYVYVPMPIYLRLLGSSFIANKIWIPELKYPETVMVRPCVPNSANHATFQLRLLGCLPVSFRFIPPKNSMFMVKPLQGVVTQSQIIVTQFTADDRVEMKFVERWQIVLNGRQKNCSVIEFASYCDTPRILVNGNNTIAFDPVMPDCQDEKIVIIKNISAHFLTYKIIIAKNCKMIKFDHYQGDLASNEQCQLKCYGSGKEGVYNVTDIKLETRIYVDYEVIGDPYPMVITTKIKVFYSELCSLPSAMVLGRMKVDEPIVREFRMFNFGESTVHYKLFVHHPDPDECERLNKFFTFTPSQADVRPQTIKKVLMTIDCDESGYFEFSVAYHVRMSRNSSQVVSTVPKQVLKIYLVSEFPTLQIEAITDYTIHGFNFSKPCLWDMANINKINMQLKCIKKGETQSVDVFLPDNEANDDEFRLTLELHNITKFPLPVVLKRNKLCNCKQIIKHKSISFREKSYACIHKDMFKATISTNEFKGFGRESFVITVKYLEAMPMHMSYNLIMPNSRTLIFNFLFNVLGSDVESPSKYLPGYNLRLPSVSLMEKDPPYYPLWFYNNTSQEVSLSITPDSGTFDSCHFEVMKYLPPDVKTLVAFSSNALLFKLTPITMKKYHAIFNLQLGETVEKLFIRGKGVPNLTYDVRSCQPRDMHSMIAGPDITFSTEYLRMHRLPTWSTTYTIVFINNHTDDIIGYSIQPNCLQGVVSISAMYGKGILKPKEADPVVIQISVFDYPTKIKMQLTTKFLNHTKYIAHKRSSMQHSLRQEQIKDEFIITEKGTFYPENKVVVEPMPEVSWKSIMFEFTNISIFDIDLHMGAEEQLRQSPQLVLALNESRVLKCFLPCTKLKLEFPIVASASMIFRRKIRRRVGPYGDVVKEAKVEEALPEAPKLANVAFIKEVLECLIFTALESKVFKAAMTKKQRADPPYYVQFDVDAGVHYTKAHTKKVDSVKKLITIAPPPHLAQVFTELISDGLHNVLHLGPPVAHRAEKDFIYDSKFKSHYTTKS